MDVNPPGYGGLTVYKSVCVYICRYVYPCVYICRYVYMYIHTIYVYVYMYTHTHIHTHTPLEGSYFKVPNWFFAGLAGAYPGHPPVGP